MDYLNAIYHAGIGVGGVGLGLKFAWEVIHGLTKDNQEKHQKILALTTRVSQLETELERLTSIVETQNSFIEQLQQSRYAPKGTIA